MQIIDMHTHTFPEKIAQATLEKLSKMSGTVYFTNGTEQDLTRSMKVAGISYSVILPVATSERQVSKINAGVISSAKERLEQGIISFGAMHPGFSTPEEEIKGLAAAGVKGIKLHPAYVSTDFDDPVYIPILEACARYNLAVTVHAGIDIGIPEHDYCSTEMVLNVLKKVPDVKLILAHMGGWHCWQAVKEDLAGAPLFFDTSFSFGAVTPLPEKDPAEAPYLLTEDEFVSLCKVLGTDRILFGTDCPWADQKTEVDKFMKLPFSKPEREAILFGNAKKLLF